MIRDSRLIGLSHDLGRCRNFHECHVYAMDDSIPRYLAVEIPCGIRSPGKRPSYEL